MTKHVGFSPNFLCMLPMATAQSSSGGVVMLHISSFMDDIIIFAHNRRQLDVAATLRQ